MPRPLIAVAAFLIATLSAGEAAAGDGAPAPDARKQAVAGSVSEILEPDGDDNLQSAAAVVQLDSVPDQGDLAVKLFGTAGGDPAMNGLYTYLAFYLSPADGWRVFRVGDFLGYRILSASAGRAELQVQENVMDDASGEIGSRERRLVLSWTPGPNATPPGEVTLTRMR